ncbi:MAG TPA: condensation domain-containing protein [Actinocrinis sp.]|nr:condensation domain-containing protein [Actinocrinis sp.]
MTDAIEATEVLMVPFAGEGSGVDELTWGQQHIWNAMQDLGSPMNMCAVRELPAGARVEEFADELRFYASRFQSMRTRLQYVPGALPKQEVVSAGEIPLEIVDVSPHDDPAQVAEKLAAWQEDTPFDYEREFPIKMTLIRQDGALTHLVMTLSHFATDAVGAMTMYNDYTSRDPRTGLAATAPAMHPLELTAQQRTPSALRQSEASLRYWDGLLRAISMRRFPDPVEPAPGSGRYGQVRMNSPAMLLALRAIGNRLGTDVSTALLGVVAVGVARVTGINPVVAQMMVSNRFRPGFAEMVSNVSQAGLFVVDLADISVAEAILRSRQASMKAYKHAYFDFARWKDLVAQVNRDRGAVVDLKCYYNDRPSQHRTDPAGAPVTVAEIEAALPSTSVPLWSELPFFNERLMVTIDDVPGAIGLIVLADTAYVPRSRMEELARELESIAVEAARDPELSTAVSSDIST